MKKVSASPQTMPQQAHGIARRQRRGRHGRKSIWATCTKRALACRAISRRRCSGTGRLLAYVRALRSTLAASPLPDHPLSGPLWDHLFNRLPSKHSVRRLRYSNNWSGPNSNSFAHSTMLSSASVKLSMPVNRWPRCGRSWNTASTPRETKPRYNA